MKKIFICSLVLFALGHEIAWTQKVTKIEDNFGTKGKIRHSSVLHDSLLPQSGILDIRWREFENKRIHTYQVNGQTKNHLPIGKWIWEEGSWDFNIGVGVNAQPAFQTTGIRNKWEGSFVDGLANGTWNYALDSVSNNGQSVSNLAKIQLNYNAGVPFGTVVLERNIHGNALKLKGNLDKNGIATGTWLLQYFQNGQRVQEERSYEKGLLRQIVLIKNKNDRQIIPIERNLKYLAAQNLGTLERSVTIGTMPFFEDEYSSKGSQLVNELLQQQYQSGWHLTAFPFKVNLNLPAYRRLSYPLTAAELKTINESKALITSQREAISKQLSGNILVNRSRSATVDTSVAYLQLQAQRLQILDSLFNRIESPAFIYKDRHGQALLSWAELLNKNINANGDVYDSFAVQLPIVINAQGEHGFFTSIANMLNQNERTLPLYLSTIEKAKQSQEREGELKALETKTIKRLERVQNLYASKSGIGATINKKWIKGDISQLMQRYANTNQYDTASTILNDINVYLDSLENWAPKTEAFDKMPKSIREQYTILVYNPYTGINDIEMVLKRRFLNKVLQELWPYMDREIQEVNDWQQWKSLWQQRFTIYGFMQNFISKEDRASQKIENKIRKERKPERMRKTILGNLN